MKRNILRWLGGVALGVTVTLGITSCTDDLGRNYGDPDLGEKKHATLSVPLGLSSPVQASRSEVDFAQDAEVKIDCYWIGVFDAETHELLGMKYDDAPRKSDEKHTRWTIKNDGAVPYTVDDIDIVYYENSPYAYILGVVNYHDVKAKNVGEETDGELINFLKAATTFEDVTKIVIDTKSADEANRARGSDWTCPVMMGYYSTAKTVIHPQLNPDGSIFVSNLPDMTGSGYVSPTEVRASLVGNGVDFNLSDGAIRLQRLLAEVNVIITVPYYNSESSNSYTQSGIMVNGIRYKVHNQPNEMYLMERATPEQASTITDKDEFLAVTANSADYNANYSDGEWVNIPSSNFAINPSNGTATVQFKYQHYENKHYGQMFSGPLDGSNFHSVREQRFEDMITETGSANVFRMLCPSPKQDWNNYASYIELQLDILKGNGSGSVDSDYRMWGYQSMTGATMTYYIHEGCTSWPDGQTYPASSPTPAVDDPKMRDFQTVRNTQYFYNIHINGVDGLLLNIQARDFEDDKIFHNDGITGTAVNINSDYVDNNSNYHYYELGTPTNEQRKGMKWVYALLDPNGNQPWNSSFTYWGNFDGEFQPYNGYNYPGVNYALIYNYWVGKSYYLYKPDLKDPNNQLTKDILSSVYVYKGKYYTSSGRKQPTSIVNEYKTLEDFINLEDNDPFLQLNSGQIFWYNFPNWYPTGDLDYSLINYYERVFYFFYPGLKDDDGCEITGTTHQFLQRAHDSRIQITTFDPSYFNHNAKWDQWNHSNSYFDYYLEQYDTYWCGAPGTVTWFYVRIQYDSNQTASNLETPDFEFKIGNRTITVPKEQIITVNNDGRNKYLRIPLYIPEDFPLYGYQHITITPLLDYNRYQPYSFVEYKYGLYLQRKLVKRNNNSGTWQWLFSDVSNSTYGYNKIWKYYSDNSNIFTSFEYGGLEVVCNKTDRNIMTAKYPIWGLRGDDNNPDETKYDCLIFSGGYSSEQAPSRSSDAMLMKFWVDRPGDIYLSYGYDHEGLNREWRAYWRSYDNARSTNYLHWAPNQNKFGYIIPEEKGELHEGNNILVDFWPPVASDGRFEKPVEVLIYMASSSGYIRSIEFRPFDIPMIAPPEFPMTPVTSTSQP